MREQSSGAPSPGDEIRKVWSIPLVLGVIALVAGCAALVWPDVTVRALVVVLGAFRVVGGLLDVVWGFATRPHPASGWLVVRGIADTLLGVIVLAWPDATVWVLAVVVGIALLVYSATTLVSAWMLRGRRADNGAHAAKGLVALLAGVIALAWPGTTVLVVAWVVGAWLVVAGIVLAVVGVRLRALTRG